MHIVNYCRRFTFETETGYSEMSPCTEFSIQSFYIKYQVLLYRLPIYTSYILDISQVTVTYSNTTLETLEKGVKYVSCFKVTIKNTRTTNFEHILHHFLVFLLLT